MGVADAGDVLGRGLEFHRHHGFGDQLTGLRADDVHTQNLVRLGVSQDLDKPGGITQRTRPAIGQKRELPRLVGHTVGLELLLGAAHPGNLGRGVDHPRDGVEVDMTVLAGNALSHRHTFFFGLVRQHGATHHVANGPHVGQVGFAVGIDHDGATLIQCQAHGLGVQTNGIGHPPNGDDQPLHVELHRLALGIGVGHGHRFLAGLDLTDLDAEFKLQTLLGEGLEGLFGHTLVSCTQEVGQGFENRHVGAQPAPDRAHLQPDHT